ncbi:hypothetical protein [Bartonella sp. MR168JLCBS]
MDFAWFVGIISCKLLAETILNVSEANVELTEVLHLENQQPSF